MYNLQINTIVLELEVENTSRLCKIQLMGLFQLSHISKKGPCDIFPGFPKSVTYSYSNYAISGGLASCTSCSMLNEINASYVWLSSDQFQTKYDEYFIVSRVSKISKSLKVGCWGWTSLEVQTVTLGTLCSTICNVLMSYYFCNSLIKGVCSIF